MDTLVHVIVLALFAGAAIAFVNSILDLAGVGDQIRAIPVIGPNLDVVIAIVGVWLLKLPPILGTSYDDAAWLDHVVNGMAVYAVIAMANAIRDGIGARAA